MREFEGYVPVSPYSPANSRALSRRRRLLTGWSPACLSQVHLKRSFLIAFMTELNRSMCLPGHLDIERFTRVFRFWWFLGVIYWPRTTAGSRRTAAFPFLFFGGGRIKISTRDATRWRFAFVPRESLTLTDKLRHFDHARSIVFPP